MPHSPIALLIPVHNDPEGLRKSLGTLPQELPLDVVVVDDGSHSPLSPPELPPPHRLFLLRLEANGGITKALNHGLAWILERGYPYVARLDAGDTALVGRFLVENPEYALVEGQACFVAGRHPRGLRPKGLSLRRGSQSWVHCTENCPDGSLSCDVL